MKKEVNAMDINLILGIIIAFVSIYIGVPDVRQDPLIYLQLNSFLLVLGGTIGSTLISTSITEFLSLSKVYLRIILGKRLLQPNQAVKIMVEISERAQKVSKQDLILYVSKYQDSFLTNAVELMSIGLEKEFVNQTLETAIEEDRRRNTTTINMIRKMGSYAPMFGMAGTVIGVIQVLKNVNDIDNIVSGMALALLTTLYGLFFSSIIFIPISNKVQSRSDNQGLAEEIIREGIWMVMEKEIPLKVEKYLSAFLTRQGNEKK